MRKKAKPLSTKGSKETSPKPKKVAPVDTPKKEAQKKLNKWILLAALVTLPVLINAIYIILRWNLTKVEIVSEDQTLYYETKYIDDNSLELGVDEVEQEGENGSEKVYYERKSYLLTDDEIYKFYTDSETEKEPVEKIIRRGTRKWQYMICSDGHYRYYTDEQFQDPKTGFTHSSEDDCAKNNQGTMIALTDAPPSASSYSSSGGLSETYIKTLELIERRERELSNNESNNTTHNTNTPTNTQSTPNNEAAEKAAKQARVAAENSCRARANSAGKSARSQLGILGQPAEIVDTEVSKTVNSTYQQCMREYGY